MPGKETSVFFPCRLKYYLLTYVAVWVKPWYHIFNLDCALDGICGKQIGSSSVKA